MLVQVLALLSLGVLSSSALPWATRPTSAGSPSAQEVDSRGLVGLIIQEILQDMKKLKLNTVSSMVIVNATVERCMHSHLKTFVSNLAGLNWRSKFIATKLDRVHALNNLPKDLDEECKTVQVTSDVFLETLETFLRLLFEKIQNG